MENIRPSYRQRDQLLKFRGRFPAAAGTVYSETFDMEDIGERGVRVDPFELLVESPELTATNLPDGASLAYSLQFSDTADFSGEVIEWSAGAAWSQAGSGAGAAAFEKRFRPATDALRYVRVKCVGAGTLGTDGLEFLLVVVT